MPIRTYAPQAPILAGREPCAAPEVVERGKEQSALLSALVNGFILRRTNALLSAHLPPKVWHLNGCGRCYMPCLTFPAIYFIPLFLSYASLCVCGLDLCTYFSAGCRSGVLPADRPAAAPVRALPAFQGHTQAAQWPGHRGCAVCDHQPQGAPTGKAGGPRGRAVLLCILHMASCICTASRILRMARHINLPHCTRALVKACA